MFACVFARIRSFAYDQTKIAWFWIRSVRGVVCCCGDLDSGATDVVYEFNGLSCTLSKQLYHIHLYTYIHTYTHTCSTRSNFIHISRPAKCVGGVYVAYSVGLVPSPVPFRDVQPISSAVDLCGPFAYFLRTCDDAREPTPFFCGVINAMCVLWCMSCDLSPPTSGFPHCTRLCGEYVNVFMRSPIRRIRCTILIYIMLWYRLHIICI